MYVPILNNFFFFNLDTLNKELDNKKLCFRITWIKWLQCDLHYSKCFTLLIYLFLATILWVGTLTISILEMRKPSHINLPKGTELVSGTVII